MSTSPAPIVQLVTLAQLIAWRRCIIPIQANKKPYFAWKEYQEHLPSESEIAEWMKLDPPAWGMVTGAVSNVIALDFDQGRGGDESFFKLSKYCYEHFEVQLIPHRQTGSGGYHVDFVYPGFRVKTMQSGQPRAWSQGFPGTDIKGDGGYANVLGRNDAGPYVWLRDPTPYPISILPPDLAEQLGLVRPTTDAPVQLQPEPVSFAPADRPDWQILLDQALSNVASGGRNNAAFGLLLQLRDNGYNESEARALGRTFIARVPATNSKGKPEPYTLAEWNASVAQVYRQPARDPWGPAGGHVVPIRRPPAPPSCGEQSDTSAGEAARESEQAEPLPKPDGEIPDNLCHYDFTDTGNAERLCAVFGKDIRFCYEMAKWLVWDGARWVVDTRGRIYLMAIQTMRYTLLQATNKLADQWAKKSQNKGPIMAMVEMAKHQDSVTITAAELDRDSYLLNFVNGTLDLRTGVLNPHRREDLITKLVHYEYNARAQCPRFLTFLYRIMGRDPDASEEQNDKADRLVKYLQKAFGYSLTGSTGEKAVFVLFGRTGSNGKTTLLMIFKTIISEYSVLLQIETLMTRVQSETSNTVADLADLRGARFAMTSEAEEGHNLQQGKIKRICQGMGSIKACRKYENPIEFDETHKLWMDTNRLPSIRDVDDDATWNRLHAIPFKVQIPSGERDKDFAKKLIRDEAPGILAWAVAGAVRWHREGLGRPPEIAEANAEWKNETDQLGRFFTECCKVGYGQARANELYTRYARWFEESHEAGKMLSNTAFGRKMRERNFEKDKDDRGWYYKGIGPLVERPESCHENPS